MNQNNTNSNLEIHNTVKIPKDWDYVKDRLYYDTVCRHEAVVKDPYDNLHSHLYPWARKICEKLGKGLADLLISELNCSRSTEILDQLTDLLGDSSVDESRLLLALRDSQIPLKIFAECQETPARDREKTLTLYQMHKAKTVLQNCLVDVIWHIEPQDPCPEE